MVKHNADVNVSHQWVRVPIGRWMRRTDSRDDMTHYPILAYGLEGATLVIWNDGTHTLDSENESFPSVNWEIWSEVE